MRADRWQFGVYKVATVFGMSPESVLQLPVGEFERRVAFIEVDSKPKRRTGQPRRG